MDRSYVPGSPPLPPASPWEMDLQPRLLLVVLDGSVPPRLHEPRGRASHLGMHSATFAHCVAHVALEKRKCVVFANVVWCCVAISTYQAAGVGLLKPVFAAMPIVSTAFAVFFINLPTVVRERLRAEDQAKEKIAVMYSASMRMIDLLCDAVVELGKDLCVIAEVPKVVSMLFLQGSTNLRGLRLSNFMEADCQQRFTDMLEGAGEGDGPDVGAFNVTLLDSMGNPLHLEVFYIHIAASVGKTRYLLGLRENMQAEGRLGVLPEAGHEQLALSDLPDHAFQRPAAPESDATSSAYSEDVDRLFVPHRLETTQAAKTHLLEHLLRQIRFERYTGEGGGSSFCCGKHEALASLQKDVASWKQELCYAVFFLHSGWQCAHCGILKKTWPSQSRCEVCGPCPGGLWPQQSGGGAGHVESTFAGEKSDLGQLLPATERLSTSKAAKRSLIEDAIKTVNFKGSIAAEPCCAKHQASGAFLEFLVESRQQPCDCTFAHYAAWQCSCCGVLRAEAPPAADLCALCEQLRVSSNAGARRGGFGGSSRGGSVAATVEL
eukprot:TRINITY_DN14197_c0_g1_i10.p1 TRINITY_DN14197_c0_g1~~TRINITY_DN14197_c0_g1_i10.p1  ORF type:complete len:548 (-),score=80.88 TRINITY_DN14197_c0_g1_i10:230-1873(-)